MTQKNSEQQEATYLAWYLNSGFSPTESILERASAELRRLHALVQQLDAQLVKQASLTASQKRRADQLELQHAMQARMHAQAAEQLAAYPQPAPQTKMWGDKA